MQYIVIPCYNESDRLREDEVAALISADLNILFVNDGSRDATLERLQVMADKWPEQIAVLSLPINQGKGEAIRLGLQDAIAKGAQQVAYLDADFATPAAEMVRLLQVFAQHPDCHVMLGARWLRLGSEIKRRTMRHYGGRVFATLASMLLGLKVYDTQCGAKVFDVNEGLEYALSQQFQSRWAFDVELIGRLHIVQGESVFREEALGKWHDKSGSKMNFMDMLSATFDLIRIQSALKQYRNDWASDQAQAG